MVGPHAKDHSILITLRSPILGNYPVLKISDILIYFCTEDVYKLNRATRREKLQKPVFLFATVFVGAFSCRALIRGLTISKVDLKMPP